LIERARLEAGGLAHLECWNLESLEAIIEASNALGLPVITGPGLSFADPQWADSGGLETFLAACRHAADRSATPVVVVLNEAKRLDDVRRGLESGADLVTMTTDDLPFEQNIERTCEVVNMARPYRAAVEGELGTPEMGQAEYRDGDGAGTLTDPAQARVFASATGVDLLAVSVGNVHGNLHGRAAIELPLVKRLAEAAQVPLVLHGGSGIAPESIPALIAAGIAKINVGAALRSEFWMAVQRAARRRGSRGSYIWLGRMSPPDPLAEARLALEQEARRRIRLISASRTATEAGTDTPAWPGDGVISKAKGD
jgi:fructose/tagatose bisphosphate aldolase